MINYPNGKKTNSTQVKKTKKSSNFSSANRGMNLESDINSSNNYYDLKDIAIIYKKPTPIKVVNVFRKRY